MLTKVPQYIGDAIGSAGRMLDKVPQYVGDVTASVGGALQKVPQYVGDAIGSAGAKLQKFPEYVGDVAASVGGKLQKAPQYIGNKINSAADQIQRRFNRTPVPNPVRRKPQTIAGNTTMLPGIGPGYRNKLVNQFFKPYKMQNQQRPQGPVNARMG